jgi:rhamnosyltransferase
MQNLPTATNTCAIVVLYFPHAGIGLRLVAIQQQVDRLIIVNNGAAPEIHRALVERVGNENSAILVEPLRNMGVASALNQGMDVALGKGYAWALLFDQDTAVDDSMLVNLRRIAERIKPLPAMIGCNYRDTNKERIFVECNSQNDLYIERKTLITSGTLLSTAAYRELGAFCDHYFIDSIDHEYCLRARRVGHRNYISCQPLMIHSIGIVLQGSGIFRRLFHSYNHPAARKYYISRNTSATVRSYWKTEPAWACLQITRMVIETTSIFLFENNRRKKLIAMWKGFLDGITHRFQPGPLE